MTDSGRPLLVAALLLAAGSCACAAPGGGPSLHALQGAGALSPFDGQQVAGVRGVVTSVQGRGFTLQSPPGEEDGDERTSEGLLVVRADSASPPAMPAVGDLLVVDGVVHERRSESRPNDLTVTTLEARSWTRERSGQPLPAPVTLGPGGRPLPCAIADGADGPGALATLESLEGMLVEVRAAIVVAPTTTSGDVVVVVDPARVVAPSAGGRGLLPAACDGRDGERLLLDDLLAKMPRADAGDRLSAPLIGVLGYAWGRYRLHPLATPEVERGGLLAETAAVPPDGALTVASYNVKNLAATSPRSRFAALARQIVEALHAPAIVALEEIQDDSGPQDDGTVSAALTLRKLTDAIVAAGGPAYRAVALPPEDDRDGGEKGGNIRVAFLLREEGGLAAAAEPERVEPGSAAWTSARKPLALRVEWQGRPLLLLANHWSSRLADDADFGARQPPQRPSSERRVAQAAVVAAYLDARLAAEPGLGAIVLGDFNDCESSPALVNLQGDGRLECLTGDVPTGRRHTTLFQGDAQALDHILITPDLRRAASSLTYGPVHLNVEFAEQASDHDPVLLVLALRR